MVGGAQMHLAQGSCAMYNVCSAVEEMWHLNPFGILTKTP